MTSSLTRYLHNLIETCFARFSEIIRDRASQVSVVKTHVQFLLDACLNGPFYLSRFYFANSHHVIFTREFAFCQHMLVDS